MAGELAPILTTLYGFYDVIFRPLLAADAYLAMGFFSICLAGMFSIIYWFMLDIEKTDRIKEKMQKHQDKMKEARDNDETDKASKHMKKSMEMNQKLMMENFKPMIGTLLFVGLVFPWLGATFSQTIPMNPDGDEWVGNLTYGGQTAEVRVENTTNGTYVMHGEQRVPIENGRLEIFGEKWETRDFFDHTGGFFAEPKGKALSMAIVYVELPFSIPFAGNTLNWLGFYIILAMPLTYIFRKALGVA